MGRTIGTISGSDIVEEDDGIANTGHPGNWFGVVTDTGKTDGIPIVQGASDPCPGACRPW